MKKKVELVVGKKVAVGVTKRLLKWLQRLTLVRKNDYERKVAVGNKRIAVV